MTDMNKVLYNIDQRNDTTDAQKATARNNIGAVSSSDVSSAISNAIGALDVADVSGLQDALDNIPRPKNGVLTIQKNGTQVTTFSADQSSNATANITVPTKTSELTNDSGFVTESTAPKEIEYVTAANTFDEIKAIVNAGHEPVLKVESSSGGVSHKLRLPLVYFETGTMSAQVARFSGTHGDKIYTYTLMAGSWSTETTTVPAALSAGNGITISSNMVSAKVKAGGGLDVGADGVYVKGHYVSYDANQGLNTTNQTNARNNINAFEAPDMTNAAPWQVVRLNENLKPTLGFAPSMYGGIYDANYGIIIGGDGNTWKKMPTIKLGASQVGTTVTDNVYQIFAMPKFWDLDHWMITDGYILAWSRVEYTKNNQKYFDYQYRSVSLSSSANKHDLTTTYTGFANDGDSLHISLDLTVYALSSSSYSARTAMFHVDIFWGFYLSNGVLGDIGYWNGYSIAPCGAFNGSTLVWPVES